MYLLDINILIALVDPVHEHHGKAVEWFETTHLSGWMTCPLTENGFIRILGNPNYPQGPESTQEACELLDTLCSLPGHKFLPDDISLRQKEYAALLPISKNLTDFYLLALAIKHKAKLSTFDKRIDPSMLKGGPASLHVIH